MTPRPRVLLVAGAYAPEFSAGGLQSQAVARALHVRMDIVVLTTATDPTLRRHDTVDGVEVSRITVTQGGWSFVRATFRMLAELIRLLPRVDLVHIQGFSSKNILIAAMAKLFARPIVQHLQTAKHDEPNAVKAQGRLAWWAYSTADLYLSVSRGLTDRYLAAGLPADRIRDVPNGVDATRFSPADLDERLALRKQLNLPLDRPVILFVGVISPDKQPHVLLEAWVRTQQNPAFASTVVFVGASDPALFELGGRLIDQLRVTAAASGFADRVIFVPPTSQVQDYFRAADIYAMPSLREGMPIALLEAMACGLACAASRLPGATDTMVEDGVSGRLVTPGDADAFATAISDLLADPATAGRMGAAARRTAEERYTMEHVADMWLDAYQHVLTTR